MSSSPFKPWIQSQTQPVQPLPCCNLSSGTAGEVLQRGFFLFSFWASGSVAKKSPTSENHYLPLEEDSLFGTEIAPLPAYFLLRVAITSPALTLATFWTSLRKKSISKGEEHSSISLESRITWTHQGVRWIPASAQGKWGDHFHEVARDQVAKFGTWFWLSKPPVTPWERSLLHGDFLRVDMPRVTMHLTQIQEPYRGTGQIGLLHWYVLLYRGRVCTWTHLLGQLYCDIAAVLPLCCVPWCFRRFSIY